MKSGLRRAVLALALGTTAAAVQAQNPGERERAQLRQLQQQMQKLQQDNSALQKERSELEGRAKEAESTKKELQDVRVRSSREAGRLRDELGQVRADLTRMTSERDKLAADLAAREAQLQSATQAAQANQKRLEGELAVLGARLKVQADSSDLCLAKHGQAMSFGARMIDRYEADRLRMCEPFTGIYKVRAENEIQALRDQLETFRLTAPSDKRP